MDLKQLDSLRSMRAMGLLSEAEFEEAWAKATATTEHFTYDPARGDRWAAGMERREERRGDEGYFADRPGLVARIKARMTDPPSIAYQDKNGTWRIGLRIPKPLPKVINEQGVEQ